MLRWRLSLGTLIIAALVGLCWLDHRSAIAGAWLFPVAVLLTVLGSVEFVDLSRAAGQRPLSWVVWGGSLVLVSAGWLGPLMETAADGTPRPDSGAQWLLIALGLGVLAALVGEMRRYRGTGGVTANVGATTLGLVYVGLLMAMLVLLRMAWGIGSLASLVIVVKMCDMGAFTVGRLMGRNKMAPRLSPGKTWEGAAGGILFALFGSWVAFRWLVPATSTAGSVSTPTWGWIAYGLVLAVVGMVGDLAESLLKRDAQRKDSSRWLPGFGGALDILDSLLLAAPVAYAFWALGWVGG